MITADEITRVLDQYPTLGHHGFDTPRPELTTDFMLQVEDARQWLQRGGSTSSIVGSYRGAHLVAAATGRYVSNGAYIIGAILSGHTPRPRKIPGPNSRFAKR